jgi:hypothetical protein
MATQIVKKDAREADLLKIKDNRGEIVRVISPHDLVVGIADYMESDLRVVGNSYMSGSLWVKHGASGTLVLPNGQYALRGGEGVQVVDDGDGGFTLNAVIEGSVSSAPKNSPYLTWQTTADLGNDKVLKTSGPLTFDPSTATIGFNVSSNLTANSLSANSITLAGTSLASLPFLALTPVPGFGSAKILSAGDGLRLDTTNGAPVITVDSTIARKSGVAFTGAISAPTITSNTLNSTNISSTNLNSTVATIHRITGSLTKLSDGTDYLKAGTNIVLTTGSNGSVTIAANAISSAPLDAQYLLLSSSSSGLLSNERILNLGSGLGSLDSGAGNSYTIKVLDTQVAFLTGAIFSGPVTASYLKSNGNATIVGTITANALSGSLTRLATGDPYLRAGQNVSLATGSDGSITISTKTGSFMSGPFLTHHKDLNFPGSLAIIEGDGIQFHEDNISGNFTIATKLAAGPGISLSIKPTREILISSNLNATFAPVDAPYLLASSSSTLSGSRVLSSSYGLRIVDGGAGGKMNIFVDTGSIAKLSGSTFTGQTKFVAGLTGSLTKLINGADYLRSGRGISLTTGSDGSITIENTNPVDDIAEIIAGRGLIGGGISGSVSLAIDDNSIAFLTGANFTGHVTFSDGLAGSLTKLVDGSPFLRAGDGILLSTGSDGSVTINSYATGTINNTFSGPVITYESSSISNSRRVKQGTGILISTSSAGEVVFSVDPQVGSAAAYLSKLALNEQLVGEVNGSNRLFDVSRTPTDSSQLMIWLNGQLLTCGAGYDYTTVGNSVMFSSGSTPQVDDSIAVMYPYVEPSSRYILNERINVLEVDGIVTGELEYSPIEPRRLLLFWNGQLLSQGISKDYTIVGKKIYINAPLEELDPDDIFIASYMAYSGSAYYEVNEEITFFYDLNIGLWKANLTHEPTSQNKIMLFMNGQLLRAGPSNDFVTSNNEIVMLNDEIDGDFRFYATYEYS